MCLTTGTLELNPFLFHFSPSQAHRRKGECFGTPSTVLYRTLQICEPSYACLSTLRRFHWPRFILESNVAKNNSIATCNGNISMYLTGLDFKLSLLQQIIMFFFYKSWLINHFESMRGTLCHQVTIKLHLTFNFKCYCMLNQFFMPELLRLAFLAGWVQVSPFSYFKSTGVQVSP